MKITEESHLDHGLTPDHIALIKERFGSREGFFIETIEIPEPLDSLQCGLWGPYMGDKPLKEPEEAYYVHRGERPYMSRMTYLPPRPTRYLTVIGGPHEGDTILYTAFGGPAAPREPGDPSLANDDEALAESRAFWAEHALSSWT